MHADLKSFYSGTSGLSVPFPKHLYPPDFQEKSRLCYYASLFNSIEINSSFYKLPQAATIKKWAADVPDNFRFTFKLWKAITHNKGLLFNTDDITSFIDAIAGAVSKAGCLLVQFPPSLTIEHLIQFEQLLFGIHEADPDNLWRIAVEFRNLSWYQQDVYDLLEEYHTCMVIHDIPASATPLTTLSTEHVYLRFHGPEGRYRGSYTDDFLYEYAQYIKDWKEDGKVVYCYFNNTMGDAFVNLKALNSFLKE